MNSSLPWILFIFIWLLLMAVLKVTLTSSDSYFRFVLTGISIGVIVGVVMYLLARKNN